MLSISRISPGEKMSKMMIEVIWNRPFAHLYFDYNLDLEEFSFGTTIRIRVDVTVDGYPDYYLMDIGVYGDKDKIEIKYPKGAYNVVIGAEGFEAKDTILDGFNLQTNEKYKDKIENKKLTESEIRDYLNALLDYVNWFTDNRAKDIIERLKSVLQNNPLEFEIKEVVENMSENDINDKEG